MQYLNAQIVLHVNVVSTVSFSVIVQKSLDLWLLLPPFLKRCIRAHFEL